MFKKRIVAMILAIALLATGVWALADGEWTVRTSVKGISNDKQAKHALKNALKEYVGYDIKPLGLLGTQVVAGTNYCILCYGSTVTAKPAHALCKVYVYEALDGKAEITKIEEIKLKNAPSGGWKLSNSKGKLKVGKNVASTLKQATTKLVGATYKPLLLLGRARNNKDGYCLLCSGKKSDKGGSTGLCIVVLRKTKGKYAVRRIDDLTVAN